MSTLVNLTLDQMNWMKSQYDCHMTILHKMCDFCEIKLSKDWESKNCSTNGCPTIFDECEECFEKRLEKSEGATICHLCVKSSDVEANQRETYTKLKKDHLREKIQLYGAPLFLRLGVNKPYDVKFPPTMPLDDFKYFVSSSRLDKENPQKILLIYNYLLTLYKTLNNTIIRKLLDIFGFNNEQVRIWNYLASRNGEILIEEQEDGAVTFTINYDRFLSKNPLKNLIKD